MWKSCRWMPRLLAVPWLLRLIIGALNEPSRSFHNHGEGRPLLGPSPFWKCTLVLSHLRIYDTIYASWLWKLREGSLRALLIIVGHSALAAEECVSLWFVMKTICHIPRIWAENIYIKTLTVNGTITRINRCPFKYSDTSCISLCKQAAWHEMT